MTTITVKNLKHAEFASEETYCFNATVYVDDKRFCYAKNDGHGGCDMYWSISNDEKGSVLNGQIAALDKKLKKERASEFETHERKDGSTFTIGPDFEWAVSDAVTSALFLKDMKGAFRRNWIFTEKGKKGLFQIANHKESRHLMPTHITKKYPGAVILNNMPEAEALVIFRSGNQ